VSKYFLKLPLKHCPVSQMLEYKESGKLLAYLTFSNAFIFILFKRGIVKMRDVYSLCMLFFLTSMTLSHKHSMSSWI